MYFSEKQVAQGGIKCTWSSVSHQDYLSLQPFCNRKSGNPAQAMLLVEMLKNCSVSDVMVSSPESMNQWTVQPFD